MSDTRLLPALPEAGNWGCQFKLCKTDVLGVDGVGAYAIPIHSGDAGGGGFETYSQHLQHLQHLRHIISSRKSQASTESNHT